MATVAAAVFAATACSSTLSGHGSAISAGSSLPPGSSSSTAPAGGSNATLSANALEEATKRAFESATAWQMTGSGQDNGSTLGLTIHYGQTSSDGILTIDGVQVGLRYVEPDLYMNGGQAFWRKAGGLGSGSSADQSALALLVGKWVHIPAGTPGLSEIGNLAIRSKFIEQIASDPNNTSFTRGPSKQINGVPAVSFVDSTDGSTIYVPETGTPYPIRIEGHGTSPGTFELSDWNVPFSAPRPPADEIFELPH